MRYWLSSISAALCAAVCLSGCLEMIRRPAAAGGGVAAVPEAPAAGLSGNSPIRADVQDSTGGEAVAPLFRASVRLQGPLPRRTGPQQENIKQVNEYALWCIEHSMWNEARSHLERALAQDSLAASLYNNLAIVYEHFGQPDKAAEFYRQARELGPGNDFYQANLELLERRQQAAADTSGEVDIFDLKQRVPGPRRDPYPQIRPLEGRESLFDEQDGSFDEQESPIFKGE